MEHADPLADAIALIRTRVEYGGHQHPSTRATYPDAQYLQRVVEAQARVCSTLLGLLAYHEQRPASDVLDTVAAALGHADRLAEWTDGEMPDRH